MSCARCGATLVHGGCSEHGPVRPQWGQPHAPRQRRRRVVRADYLASLPDRDVDEMLKAVKAGRVDEVAARLGA
jgi:hypothetical protein